MGRGCREGLCISSKQCHTHFHNLTPFQFRATAPWSIEWASSKYITRQMANALNSSKLACVSTCITWLWVNACIPKGRGCIWKTLVFPCSSTSFLWFALQAWDMHDHSSNSAFLSHTNADHFTSSMQMHDSQRKVVNNYACSFCTTHSRLVIPLTTCDFVLAWIYTLMLACQTVAKSQAPPARSWASDWMWIGECHTCNNMSFIDGQKLCMHCRNKAEAASKAMHSEAIKLAGSKLQQLSSRKHNGFKSQAHALVGGKLAHNQLNDDATSRLGTLAE